MTRKIKGNPWLLFVITVLGLGVVGFAAIHRPTHTAAPLDTRPNGSSIGRHSDKAYVNRGLLSSRLALHLNVLGNRLEKPGKERVTIAGVLRFATDSQDREIAATLEFPDRLRVLVQKGSQSRLSTFDGKQAKGDSDELDLIETLAYDSAEHFFATLMQGNAMRFLGARFRTDDGSSPDYNGPYFDIYKISDQIETSGQERAAKLYYFNSDTLLLERVTYIINRDGTEINVETKLSDWRESAHRQYRDRALWCVTIHLAWWSFSSGGVEH